MNKIWLIIKREYTSRVLKKSFLLITILTPLSIVLIGVVAGLMTASSGKSFNIAMFDESKTIQLDKIEKNEDKYTLVDSKKFESLKKTYSTEGFDVLVKVPKLDSLTQTSMNVQYFSKEKLSIKNINNIEENIDEAVEEYKLSNSSIKKEDVDNLKMSVSLENALNTEESSANSGENSDVVGDKSSKLSSIIATGISGIMGFLMYMVIFIFGGMVMRSVMEEKINRVVEVMVSTVKPFDLLLGKIIGVGLVGLTQLLIWMILIPIGLMITAAVLGIDTSSTATSTNMLDPEMIKAIEEGAKAEPNKIAEFLTEFRALNWWLILPVFIIFFFGGYFLYSALFAAVGASIGDDLTEGQQLMMPIIAPVIIAFIMLQQVIVDPNSNLAIFGSMFPLFSPIIMPARLAFDPPLWQVGLSIVFLIAGVVAVTMFAARIYRVGIFMYGKKASFKDIGKWLFIKG
jgi:ABC-2 type transport system permease protein